MEEGKFIVTAVQRRDSRNGTVIDPVSINDSRRKLLEMENGGEGVQPR